MGMGNGGFGSKKLQDLSGGDYRGLMKKYAPYMETLRTNWDGWHAKRRAARQAPASQPIGTTMPTSFVRTDPTMPTSFVLPEQASPVAQERAGGLMGGYAAQQLALPGGDRFMGGMAVNPLSMHNLPRQYPSVMGGMGGYSSPQPSVEWQDLPVARTMNPYITHQPGVGRQPAGADASYNMSFKNPMPSSGMSDNPFITNR